MKSESETTEIAARDCAREVKPVETGGLSEGLLHGVLDTLDRDRMGSDRFRADTVEGCDDIFSAQAEPNPVDPEVDSLWHRATFVERYGHTTNTYTFNVRQFAIVRSRARLSGVRARRLGGALEVVGVYVERSLTWSGVRWAKMALVWRFDGR